MSEDVDDVRRALTIVFRGADGLARADVERTFSFDMEWVAPNDSEAVVDALLSTGGSKSESINFTLPLNSVRWTSRSAGSLDRHAC